MQGILGVIKLFQTKGFVLFCLIVLLVEKFQRLATWRVGVKWKIVKLNIFPEL